MVKTVIFFTIFLVAPVVAEGKADLVVKVTNMRNINGVVSASLFSNTKGFPNEYEHANKTTTVSISQDTVTLVFRDVNFGKYAVAVMHDENRNNKFDTNFLGIPQEGFAVSNNIESRRRAPRFSEAIFEFQQKSEPLVLRLIYF